MSGTIGWTCSYPRPALRGNASSLDRCCLRRLAPQIEWKDFSAGFTRVLDLSSLIYDMRLNAEQVIVHACPSVRASSPGRHPRRKGKE